VSSCELRPDGWPVPSHVDCFNEIDYLRKRVEVAEEVVRAVRGYISPTPTTDEWDLVAKVNTYADFLGLHPDPSRYPYPVGPA
jgi:hypothetical protein